MTPAGSNPKSKRKESDSMGTVDVPADRYAALRLAAEQQLRLYARSTSAPASPGSASLLASEIAGAIRPDERWAFNGTSCARLAGSGKVSVLFWLESLQSALRGELGIHEGRIQGRGKLSSVPLA